MAGPTLDLTDDGRLPPCPPTPNCVSSDAPADDSTHHIAPLAAGEDPRATWERLTAWVKDAPRWTIVEQRDGYLHAEARTRLLRFVDDVMFHLREDDGVIAMRSASHMGYSDLGTNRRRLEAVRDALER
jgi:uncharacterized protein (DUF1499 family)